MQPKSERTAKWFDMVDSDRPMTVTEFAERFSVTKAYLWKLRSLGVFETLAAGRCALIHPEDQVKLVEYFLGMRHHRADHLKRSKKGVVRA